MKKIFLLIVAVAAMAACNDNDSKQDWGGLKYYTFDVTGKVTDMSHNPIEGICVEAQGVRTTTKADGTYRLKGDGNGETGPLFINFTDLDGEDNGGKHVGATRRVTLTYVTGAHGPYLGLFSVADVDVVLTTSSIITPPSTDQPVTLQ